MGIVSLPLLGVWLLLAFLITGAGFVILRILRQPIESHNDLFRAFWTAFAISILLLEVWHLFEPINALPFVILMISGVSGLVLQRAYLMGMLRTWRKWIIPVICFVGFGLYLTRFAITGIMPYDDGLYHIQDMRWAQTSAIVPGLGNLHGRLAFNNSLSLFWAMLASASPVLPRVQAVGYGMLLCVMLGQLVVNGWNFFHHKQRDILAGISALLIVPITLIAIQSRSMIGLKNDLVIFFFGVLLSVELLRLLLASQFSWPRISFALFYMTLLAAIGVSIKLSFAAFAGLILLVALGFIGSRYRKYGWQSVLLVFVIGLSITSIWLLRGVILSGYPLYPQTLLSVPVDWRMPIADVINENRWIMSWARMPYQEPDVVLGNWNWLHPWLQFVFTQRLYFTLPLVFITCGVLLWLIRRDKKNLLTVIKQPLFWWFLPFIGGMLFWFFTAPDLRFGWHLFWPASVGLVITALDKERWWRLGRIVLGVVLLGTFVFYMVQFSRDARVDAWSTQPPPTFITNSGLKLYLPIIKDQCFDLPLPCTPYPDPLLELRDPNAMASGFRHAVTAP